MLGLITFAVAGDGQTAYARGGGGGHGGGGGGFHGGGYRGGYYGGYGRGGYGYGGYGYNPQAQQNQAWTQAHQHPQSLGSYSSVPSHITSANQSYVVREYSWPSSSQLAATKQPSQLAGKSDLTR